MKRNWFVPVLATSGALGAALLAAALLNPLRSRAQPAAENRPPKPTVVEYVSPQRRDLVRQIRLAATVQPWEETQLYAKVSGYLREIYVDKGAVVRRGQLLATLDVPEMADELAQQRAQESAAQARSREPVVSLETARAEVDRAERELEQARAELDAARVAAQEPESQRPAAEAEVAAMRAAAEEPRRDVETAQANLRAARSDLQAAEADLDRYQADDRLRERTYHRYKELLAREVVAQQEFDQVEAAYNAARAALETARTKIGTMKEHVAAAQSAVRAAEARLAAAQARVQTPLAQMQNIDARARTAQARVAAAEKAVSMAEAKVKIARARLDEIPARIASARSDVATAAAGSQRVRTLMQYSRLTAPYEGVVTARNVDPGQLIQASTANQAKPLVVVSSIDRVRITVPVPESDVPHLKVGNAVSLTVRDLPGRTWTGRIARYTNDLDPAARTMTAEIDLPNPDRALRPGMYADVVISLERHSQALVVPTSAVVAEKQKRSLWVARDGRAQKVEVAVGVDNGVDAEITSGIGERERVIVSGQANLQRDQPVEARPARTWSLPGSGGAGRSR
jgi:RND family efflux transporter MFP subunit